MPARHDTPRQRLHRKKPEYGQTKTARLAYERVIGNVVDLEYDGLTPYWVRDHIPEAWDRLEKDVDVFEKKVQITSGWTRAWRNTSAPWARATSPGSTGCWPPSPRCASPRSTPSSSAGG